MPNPAWVTLENVKFNGTTENAVVLSTNGAIRKLILWDELSLADQGLLTNVVTNFGGSLPLSTTAGKQTIVLSNDPITGVDIVGTDATGLDSVAASSSGTATINIGGDKLVGDASGLTSTAGTAGYHAVNYSPVVVGANNLGLTLSTAGRQTIDFGGLLTGAGVTGLANDATAYTASITVDGVLVNVSIVGSAAQTVTDLITELNTDLGVAATAALNLGNITVTSATTGLTSTVAIVDGTLLAALTGFVDVDLAVAGTAAPAYALSVNIDGVAYPVTVDSNTVTTFTQLVARINAVITTNGTAAITGGKIVVTSATSGVNSSVVITPGTALPATAGFLSLQTPVHGDGTARTYSAQVEVDGRIVPVVFTGVAGTTIGNVIAQINTDLGATATAALTGGNIVITSASTGNGSTVKVYDSGQLFSSLTDFVGIVLVAGDDSIDYDLTATYFDGATTVTTTAVTSGPVSPTYADLVTDLNTQFGGDLTFALVNGNLQATNSSGTGAAYTVSITGGSLLDGLPAFVSVDRPVPGVTNLEEALNVTLAPNGSKASSVLPIITVGAKPAVPKPVAHTLDYTYWDGTNWKYLDNDAVV